MGIWDCKGRVRMMMVRVVLYWRILQGGWECNRCDGKGLGMGG